MDFHLIIAGGPYLTEKMIVMFGLVLLTALACSVGIAFGISALLQGHHKKVGLAMVVIPLLIGICTTAWFFGWIRFEP